MIQSFPKISHLILALCMVGFCAFQAVAADDKGYDKSASQKGKGTGMGGGPFHDRWDPTSPRRGMWGTGMGLEQSQRMARHWTFMHSGIPVEYRGISNPLPMIKKVIDEGGALYKHKCASCHGPAGMGNGSVGKGLNPSPALLAYMIQMPMTIDEYLIWSISEGGLEFGSEMPAFKEELDRKDMWKIVTFMRAGFPEKKMR